jgi:tripartite ATP-independent transporter DctM subunit
MGVEWVTVAMIAIFIVLLTIGLPFPWAMGATATMVGFILFEPGFMQMMVGRIYDLMLNYALVAVPLFIFMATILQQSGVVEQLFRSVYIWCGRLRGGLAIATIISCIIMAALVGIIGAEVVTFGLISLPAMLERKYDKRLALGSIAAGGGLATLIPPSVVFILYGMICSVSIGELYMGGIIPGLLIAGMFMAYIVIVAWLKPEAAPAAPLEERNIPLIEKVKLLRDLIMPFILIMVVLGSIYAGLATPTEAAGIGCIGGLLSAVLNRKLTTKGFKKALYDTILISSMLAWLLFGSQMIIGVYTLAGGDAFVRTTLMAIPFGKWGVLITMQIIWIILGCLIDWVGILMLTMPLFFPIIKDFGFHPVWFGVVFCMNMHIAYLTPPFAPASFYLKSVTPPEITLEEIFKATMPFLYITVLATILVTIFPQLSLWLPSKMMK